MVGLPTMKMCWISCLIGGTIDCRCMKPQGKDGEKEIKINRNKLKHMNDKGK